jgi:hypothetical protein
MLDGLFLENSKLLKYFHVINSKIYLFILHTYVEKE